MANLGTPYRIVYEAKGQRTGLNDVRAFVVKPDMTVAGVFAMSEMPFGSLAGVYYCDLMTSQADPEGEWIGAIISPTEGVRATARISLTRNIASDVQALVRDFLSNGIKEELRGYVLPNEVEGRVETGTVLVGYVLDDGLRGEIEDDETETTGTAEDASDIEGTAT
jgi:hypothetical protein